jgi:hypothetical protein
MRLRLKGTVTFLRLTTYAMKLFMVEFMVKFLSPISR